MQVGWNGDQRIFPGRRRTKSERDMLGSHSALAAKTLLGQRKEKAGATGGQVITNDSWIPAATRGHTSAWPPSQRRLGDAEEGHLPEAAQKIGFTHSPTETWEFLSDLVSS